MAVSKARRTTRLLVYTKDVFGLGHLSRALKICDQLANEIPDLSILVLTGVFDVHAFRISTKLDYVKLPCLHRLARSKYVPKYLKTSFKDLMGMREDLIHSTVKNYKPHIMLVDHVPIGIKGELLKSLRWLKANSPKSKVILSLRDILDDPEYIRRLWEKRKYAETLEEFYDSIWVFGSPTVYDMVKEYGFPESIAKKMNYCGYVMHSPALRDKDEVRRELGFDAGKFVLVTAGGGGDGYNLMKNYLKGLKLMHDSGTWVNGRSLNSLLILGPEMPLEKKRRLMQRAESTPGRVKVLDFTTELLNYMNTADLVISMGGYNTVCEILTLGKRAILVPRVHPVNEQWIRTTRMEALGLVEMIHPDQLNPELLSRRIESSLHETDAKELRAASDVLDTNALPRISRFVFDEVRERTAS